MPGLAISFSTWCPSRRILRWVRKYNEIQLTVQELELILNVLRQRPCDLLVFGLGNDSLFWSKMNRGGRTVFLEDDQEWFAKVLKRNGSLTAYLVDYRTVLTQWEQLLDSPAVYDLDLPDEVQKVPWDVILVDAPAGWHDAAPGRMKSIAAASRLVRDSGDVFVHDCERPVENIYSERYLKRENFVAEVGKLKHFHVRRESV